MVGPYMPTVACSIPAEQTKGLSDRSRMTYQNGSTSLICLPTQLGQAVMTFKALLNFVCRCAAVLTLLAALASAATIKDVQVPRYVENASASVDLLCEFVRGDMDEHLVLRWLHSEDSSPVFQWIPEIDSFEVSGIFVGHVSIDEARKMSSTKSEDLTSKFGLRLLKPTTVHEGKYKCYVTSVANTDEREGELVIFVPPRDTKLYYNQERRMMTCRVQRVYPLPKVALYRSSKKGDLVEEIEYVKREDKHNEDGTYDILVRKYMSQPPPERYECWIFLDIDYKVLDKAYYIAGQESVVESDTSGTMAGPTGWRKTIILLWTAFMVNSLSRLMI